METRTVNRVTIQPVEKYRTLGWGMLLVSLWIPWLSLPVAGLFQSWWGLDAVLVLVVSLGLTCAAWLTSIVCAFNLFRLARTGGNSSLRRMGVRILVVDIYGLLQILMLVVFINFFLTASFD